MTESEELAYEKGCHDRTVTVFGSILREVRAFLPEKDKSEALLVREIAQSRIKIRELCEYLGVEFDEAVYLPDLLERCLDAVSDVTEPEDEMIWKVSGTTLVYCKYCNKTHAVVEGETMCAPNAWLIDN